MRRAVEGRFTVLRVLVLETGFTAFTFLTVAVTFWGAANAFAVRVVEVLRVRLLRGVVVDAVLEDLTGIRIDPNVYSLIIHKKRTPWGSCVTVC